MGPNMLYLCVAGALLHCLQDQDELSCAEHNATQLYCTAHRETSCGIAVALHTCRLM
jgi:hypothetical protein